MTESDNAPPTIQSDRPLPCPLCEYDLRGQTTPRCPECGRAFDPAELRDPARRKHPYLFEHHPKRNVVSWIRTTLGTLRPSKFWRTLRPVQPPVLGRLVLYALIGDAFLLLMMLGTISPRMIDTYRDNVKLRAAETTRYNVQLRAFTIYHYTQTSNAEFQSWLDRRYPLPPSWAFFQNFQYVTMIMLIVIVCSIYLAWPWAAFIVLLLFRASMRRAKIHNSHVLRCTIYSADLLPLALGVACATGYLFATRFFPFTYGVLSPTTFIWCVLLAVALTVSWRLVRAYQLYLGFNHSVAVVLSVQMILFLISVQAAITLFGFEPLRRLLSELRV